jgi:nicotinate-nucleotide--dimethylbenzimidazole phosphoribosyltransferase
MKLNDALADIVPLDLSLEPRIQSHLDDLTKPPGSLGELETIAKRYCIVQNSATPSLPAKKIFCMAGDHGVAGAGVSAFPQEVTRQMVLNMLSGGAAINVLARQAGAELAVVDMGICGDINAPGLIQAKVKAGTGNIAEGPAMSVEEATLAVETGIGLAVKAVNSGIELIGTGDMGIANTTPSAALYARYLGIPAEDIAGAGTGISGSQLEDKIRVINRALEVNSEAMTDPLSILAAIGGFEIAGICGVILGGAACRTPIVVDGFISTAAAVAAMQMKPCVRDYLFFSHRSAEKGHGAMLEQICVRPILDLGLRLGEGTGSAMAMMLIDSALRIYTEMATFSSARIAEKCE